MPDQDFTGKVLVITGASSGFGKGIEKRPSRVHRAGMHFMAGHFRLGKRLCSGICSR
jgi:NADP-dependent 3-hydroxy acid dehydrogenase YdfG